MSAVIEMVGPDKLAEYASVPMVCEVRSILRVEEIAGGIGGLKLLETPVEHPYKKNYDALPEAWPLEWPRRFDISSWGLFIARKNGPIVGGATVAMNLGLGDTAVLWDIRVRPECTRQGIGKLLFVAAVNWAHSKGCKSLRIETQNVNVGACRFYAKMGCLLDGIDRTGYQNYPGLAHEIMLTWILDLSKPIK